MTPEDIDRVFGQGRLRMTTGAHVEVIRERARSGEERRYTKRFLAGASGDFRRWTEREWRILERLGRHAGAPVAKALDFLPADETGPDGLQTRDAGATVDQWASSVPLRRGDIALRSVFEDCAHWWSLARQCLIALDALHSLGFVHLEFKPDNICLPWAPAGAGRPIQGQPLLPRFRGLVVIDVAFSLFPEVDLVEPLPLLRQPAYEYQSPRLLHALEEGRRGNLAPTQALDWRCDLFSLAAMLWRYLPEAPEGAGADWTESRIAEAGAFVRQLLDVHNAAIPPQWPHRALIALASLRLREPDFVASIQAGRSFDPERTLRLGAEPVPATRVTEVPKRRPGARRDASGDVVVSAPGLLGESAEGAGASAPSPSGASAPSPSGASAPAPSGASAPAPFGGSGPTPSGTSAPAPFGSSAPTPLGASAPAPLGASAPAPLGAVPGSAARRPGAAAIGAIAAAKARAEAAQARAQAEAGAAAEEGALPAGRGHVARSRSRARAIAAASGAAFVIAAAVGAWWFAGEHTPPFGDSNSARQGGETFAPPVASLPADLPPRAQEAASLGDQGTSGAGALAALRGASSPSSEPAIAAPVAAASAAPASPVAPAAAAALARADSAELDALAAELMRSRMPRVAEAAQRQLARVLRTAADARELGRRGAVRSAAQAARSSATRPTLVAAVHEQEARTLNDAALVAYGRDDGVADAVRLQRQAFAANPLDSEVVGNLAFLRLKEQPPQGESARQLALHALTLDDARFPTGRIEDWTTLAVASALAGRDSDARHAWYASMALTSDLQRQCDAAVRALTTYGDRLRPSVLAMLQRARSSAAYGRCEVAELPAPTRAAGKSRSGARAGQANRELHASRPAGAPGARSRKVTASPLRSR